ncbi:MAG: phosphotransferase [Deltaproteobacteria bacterium]|nr:phosphotransferase [Deltaproteobacteria bacterium]
MTVDPALAEAVTAWSEVARDLAAHGATRPTGGLINATWVVGRRWVVQRLHPIFGGELHHDIAALTPHLVAAGVPVPPLVAADDGRLWVDRDDGAWRVLRFLPGATLHQVETLGQVRSAARALARFHGALAPVRHEFAFARLGIHDTEKHLANLRAAVAAHPEHRLAGEVAPLAEAIFSAWAAFPAAEEPLPARIGHGDPKLANFLFEGDDVVAILDLDTLGWTTLDAEIGDALRSWCNAASEDDTSPEFLVDRYCAARDSYLAAARDWVTPAEAASFPWAAARIALELSSRFLADALNESYFGWDAARFATRGEHNLVRARGQLALAQDVLAKRELLA